MPTNLNVLVALSLLLATSIITLSSAWCQETGPIQMSDEADSHELPPGHSLTIDYAMSFETEGGIQFRSTDSLDIRIYTHPKDDLSIENGSLHISCKGLDTHDNMVTNLVSLSGGQLGNKTGKDMMLQTVIMYNPHDHSVRIDFESFGETRRIMVVGTEQLKGNLNSL